MSNSLPLYRIIALTDVGLEREHNEDYYLLGADIPSKKWLHNNEVVLEVTEPKVPGTLLIIADGMGGANAGEVASSLACQNVSDHFTSAFTPDTLKNEQKIRNFLFTSIINSHESLVSHQMKEPETKGMGTTIVLAWILEKTVHVAWVGDSRCYLFRNGQLQQVTKDHSYVQELVDLGRITYEQAFFHPERNLITNSLGSPDHPPKVNIDSYTYFQINRNDRLLLCTDGLNGMLQDNQIEQIFKNKTDIQECGKTLIEEANKAGGTDNITLFLCDFTSYDYIAEKSGKKDAGHSKKGRFKYLYIIIFIVLLVVISYFIVSFLNTGQPSVTDDSDTLQTNHKVQNNTNILTNKNIITQKDTEYENIILQADSFFNAEKYEEALPLYKKANKLIPKDSYPKEKISVIENILDSQSISMEENINKTISNADTLFERAKKDGSGYNNSLLSYKKALLLTSKKSYPKEYKHINDQICIINKYDSVITNAKKSFDIGDYEKAKTNYKEAKKIIPFDSYSEKQIKRCEENLRTPVNSNPNDTSKNH